MTSKYGKLAYGNNLYSWLPEVDFEGTLVLAVSFAGQIVRPLPSFEGNITFPVLGTGGEVEPPIGPTAPDDWLLTSFVPGASRNDFTGEVGVRYGIGPVDVPVNWVGTYCSASSGTRTVKINEWFADANLRTVTVDMAGKPLYEWVWTEIAPLTLLANGYYAVMQEVTAFDGLLWSNADVNAIAIGSSETSNLYSTYRVPGGGLNANTPNAMYVGLDLGWNFPDVPTIPVTSGLAVQHDASQLALADGATVTAWLNTGTANQAALVGTPLPTFKAAVTPTGLPAVRFTANGAGLRGDNRSLYSGMPMKHTWSMLYVARRWGPIGGRCFTAPYPEGENVLIGYHTSGFDCSHQPGGWIKAPTAFGTPPDPWKLYSQTDQESVGVHFYINGVDQAGLLAISTALNYYYCLNGYQLANGGNNAGAGEGGDFDVCELLIYDRCLSDAERIQVEGYLRDKWGLTLSAELMLWTDTAYLTRIAGLDGNVPFATTWDGILRETGIFDGTLSFAPTLSGSLGETRTYIGNLPFTVAFAGVMSRSYSLVGAISFTIGLAGILRINAGMIGDLSFDMTIHGELFRAAERQLEASLPIQIDMEGTLGVSQPFEGDLPFEINFDGAAIDIYIGPFWDPDDPKDGFWIPDTPVPDGWVPISASGSDWTPDVPKTQFWVPDTPVKPGWSE
jgi:hypothetical protein